MTIESTLIKKLIALTVIILLLVLAGALILLHSGSDKPGSTQTLEVERANFSYDQNRFRQQRQNCTTAACLDLIAKPGALFSASLRLDHKPDRQTPAECLGVAVRADSTPAPQLPEIRSAFLVQDLNLASLTIDQELRLLAGQDCYSAQFDLTPIDSNAALSPVSRSRLLDRYEQLLDVTQSITLAGYSSSALKQNIKDHLESLNQLIDVEGSGLDQPNPDTLPVDQLPVENSKIIYQQDNLVLTLMRIVEDSRCPAEVNCIDAGTVVLEVMVKDLDEARSERQLLELKTPVSVFSYQLLLNEVNPDRTVNSEIDLNDYRFMIEVKQINNGSNNSGPATCVRAGCSSQLCVRQEDSGQLITTCEYKLEYACYAEAECELQSDGECGFTPSDELTQCLESTNSNDEE
jgi:hypothetical protein